MCGARTSSSTPRYVVRRPFPGIAIDAAAPRFHAIDAARLRVGRGSHRDATAPAAPRPTPSTPSRRRRDTVTATPSRAGAREARPR